ncbi:MAG: S8 family serine peptidase [Ginsengibacter sp.]
MKRFPKTLNTSDEKESVLDESRILVEFSNATTTDKVQEIAKQVGLVLESYERSENQKSGKEVNNTDHRYWLRSADNSSINDEEFSKIEQALANKVEWIGPVYKTIDRTQHVDLVGPVPNVLLIRKQFGNKFEQQISKLELKLNEPKSEYLSEYNYFELPDAKRVNAFEIQHRLDSASGDILFESMPMIRDWCAVPNDTLFAQQWNMTRIQGPQAWDLSTGINTVVVAVLDSGVDLTHPDLHLAGTGIDLGDMVSDGSPNNFGSKTGHGTCCAGIVAGTFNNATGVAGVAGSCRILPIAISTFSNTEIAAGINWAVAHGANAVSMSFSIPQSAIVDTALANAFAANVVLCAATANDNLNAIGYPARHPNVMAIGASDQADNRKSPTSPDGEGWGSNFGAEISVVAPGVLIPSTDIQGTGGFNPAAGAAGNYHMTFNGTSSATPHVAGLAALIRSRYTALTSAQIRNIIERSAQKTGTVAYAETAGKSNGTWNQQMGYGRINAFRSLDFADIIIKDWAGDTGAEPSTSGNFWDFSDIVVRINDDNVFNPSNPSQSKNVEKGQQNFIYIRVTNNGPRQARNVVVSCRITPYVGTQFHYPSDWNNTDATHVAPAAVTTTFPSIASGSSAMAKFTISAAQTNTLYGWVNSHPWHPCLLAKVTADNDFAFAAGGFTIDPLSQRKNNLAQRNLSVIDVLGDMASATLAFPFIAGHLLNAERTMKLTIDKRALPAKAELLLSLDDDGSYFPLVNFDEINSKDDDKHPSDKDVVYLEKTKIKTTLGCCHGILTLEKGSYFKCCSKTKTEPVNVKGGEVILKKGKRYVRLQENVTTIELEKDAQKVYPFSVVIDFNNSAEKGKEYVVKVSQQNVQGTTVGGATVIYNIK